MLIGIHPLLTADLLHAMVSMGHGDEIALVDANFPAASVGRRVIPLPGTDSPESLAAVLIVFPLEAAAAPAAFAMAVVGDPAAVPRRSPLSRTCSHWTAWPASRSANWSATRPTSGHRERTRSCARARCASTAISFS